MTWKATFFLKKLKSSDKENFGFKSSFDPKRLPEMREFEEKMLDMVQNVEFKNTNQSSSKFQKDLKGYK